jgi:hypothetical protein
VASGGLSANKERVFFIYFDKLAQASPETAGPADRMSALPIARFGLFREAEDAADYTCPTGWCFGTNTIEGASGPKNPNALSVAVHPQKYLYWDNAGFPVTIPSSGSYALTLRVRSDPGDHEFEILVDNESVRKGKLTFGDGWTMATVPDLSLSQGVHSLEVFLMNGKERPLDFDCLWLTNYAEFQPKGFLQCSVGQGEVKP